MPRDSAQDEAVVVRWIEAINTGDLDGALACLDPDVDFHPLRLGVDGAYRGHDGVRSWFEEIARLASRHRITIAEIRRTDDGELLAVGSLGYSTEREVSPFCGSYVVSSGCIVTAHHYLTDAATFEHVFGPATQRA